MYDHILLYCPSLTTGLKRSREEGENKNKREARKVTVIREEVKAETIQHTILL